MLNITEAWKVANPNAHLGFLVMHAVNNPPTHPELERQKQGLENQLRAQFTGQDRQVLESFSNIPAYIAYYKQFNKTNHIQAQLESIVFKGKSIPSVAALVEAMFMAEVKNLLLTAGHDFGRVQFPVTLNVAGGHERYTLLRGQEQSVKAGDMLIADQVGVISSIVYGPDQRTKIDATTHGVVFTVYAPGGIDVATVQTHLQDIREYVLIVSPQARVQIMQVFGAQSP